MALIPDLSDIPELIIVDRGEYDLEVTKAKEIKSKKTGRKAIQLICDIQGEDNAETLFHSMWLPMPSDDEEKANMMWRMIKEQVEAFGLDTSQGLEAEDFYGLAFSALLDIEEDEEGQYPPKNIIVKIT